MSFRKKAKVSSKTQAIRKFRERVRQAKIEFPSSKAPTKLPQMDQKRIDQLITNYIISQARPLSTVDDPAFIALVNGLNPRANVMGAKKLRTMVEEERQQFHKNVIEDLSSAKYVCLTADMWTASHRGWIVITAHWLEAKDLARRSVALCCNRIKG